MTASLRMAQRCALSVFLILSSLIVKAQNDKAYLSTDKIFILNYPSNWRVDKFDKMMGTAAEVILNAPNGSAKNFCRVQVEIRNMDEAYKGSNIRELAEVELKMLRATKDQQANLEIDTSDFVKYNDKEWWHIHGTMKQGKKVFFTDSYKTIHSSKVYVVTYISVEKVYADNVAAAKQMVEKFEFLTKDDTVYKTKIAEKPVASKAAPAAASKPMAKPKSAKTK